MPPFFHWFICVVIWYCTSLVYNFCADTDVAVFDDKFYCCAVVMLNRHADGLPQNCGHATLFFITVFVYNGSKKHIKVELDPWPSAKQQVPGCLDHGQVAMASHGVPVYYPPSLHCSTKLYCLLTEESLQCVRTKRWMDLLTTVELQ